MSPHDRATEALTETLAEIFDLTDVTTRELEDITAHVLDAAVRADEIVGVLERVERLCGCAGPGCVTPAGQRERVAGTVREMLTYRF